MIMALAFSINTDLDSLLDSRKIDLEVIVGTHKGCMIPKEGIFYDNGVEGVYVFERGEKCFKPVELVVEDEDNIIVNGIKQGDKILLNKRGLDELFKAKYTTNQKRIEAAAERSGRNPEDIYLIAVTKIFRPN